MSDNMLEELENEILEDDQCICESSNLTGYGDWYKKNADSKVWWIDELDVRGRHLFSFDRHKIYNLFADYPHNMTDDEVKIFDNEEKYWADFLKSRKQ
ncbi:TPA: hypothetical protein TU245_001820 [Streptococcus equi subsp. zooepidemicus]|uniref:DUF7675 family protein n=1 Tax=Streptococcus equi TaxID=1336 RepID=UPI001E60E68C|nr:hypothetical protein [Streptococcus equi]MCD3372274.1 hypothetical protein [Streptococcus equi subsp. zooepidemicus]HEL0795677.1 hypothetical protein [Streptococcus equi subsp. zooepidemicus]